MQANVEAVRVAGLVTTLVSMAGDNRRMDNLPNSVGPRVRSVMHACLILYILVFVFSAIMCMCILFLNRSSPLSNVYNIICIYCLYTTLIINYYSSLLKL